MQFKTVKIWLGGDRAEAVVYFGKLKPRLKRKQPDQPSPIVVHTAMARMALGHSADAAAAIANMPTKSVLNWSLGFPSHFGAGHVELLARDVEEAVQFAQLLASRRGCDLFRGQKKEWPPIATFYRLSFSEQMILNERWRKFTEWASGIESLRYMFSDRLRQGAGEWVQRDINIPNLHLIAIAQHFGFPTGLLDFTEDARIAAFFATESASASDTDHKCIFCLSSNAIEQAYQWASGWQRVYETQPQLVKLGVPDLWRMKAQRGAFVHANQQYWADEFKMDVVRFPATTPVSTPSPEQVYPPKMSKMESMIEEYFTIHGRSLTDDERKRACAKASC